MTSSAEITRKSQSNLAFALSTLPPARKRDMISFYAFCRVIDDIADDEAVTAEVRRSELARWRSAVLGGPAFVDPVLQDTLPLPERYGFPREHLAEIIDGCLSDLDRTRYRDFAELQGYCYQVACVVGLASMKIFGAQASATAHYAEALGYALQLTNIIRDVGEDAGKGRIYLPQAELEQFGVTEADILSGQASPGFLALMEFQRERAEGYYREAESCLPASDRKVMVAARMMGHVYRDILHKLHRQRYPVFERRMKLSKWRKGYLLTRYTVGAWLR
jgi:15-cis-phytoene synthase